jgi:hypothetical protein
LTHFANKHKCKKSAKLEPADVFFFRLYKREIFIPSGVVLANCLKLSQQWRAKLYKLNVAGGLPEGVLFLLNIKALLLRGIN